MKKSNFAALLLGTASGLLFALGMCMALVDSWDAFRPGVALGCAGVLMGLITVWVWRKMEGRGPVRFSARRVLHLGLGVAGALILGVGICLCLVWGRMLAGVGVGVAGIFLLLGLIPLTRGLRD